MRDTNSNIRRSALLVIKSLIYRLGSPDKEFVIGHAWELLPIKLAKRSGPNLLISIDNLIFYNGNIIHGMIAK